MRRFLVLSVLTLMVFSGLFAQKNDYSDYVIINKYDDAVRVAEFTGKPIMVLFSMATCKDCDDFKETTLMDEDVMTFLKERFIVVDIQPYPHLRGRFPLNTEDSEIFSYSELFRKYGVKRTPTAVFFDSDFSYTNRTIGVFDSEIYIETVRGFDQSFVDTSLRVVNVITEEMALLMLNTLPNTRLIDFNDLHTVVKSLNRLDYHIIDNGNIKNVKEILQENGIALNNVFVYESDINYVSDKESEMANSFIDGNWTDINREQVIEVLSENLNSDDFFILDVRTADEYDKGSIENSINMDFFSDDFKNKLSKYDKTATYLVMCQSGGRSTRTVKLMEELGFEFVYHYKGGYSDWVQE
jgi:rhodanese-related sulfurtransferase/thioredoxin-related protein